MKLLSLIAAAIALLAVPAAADVVHETSVSHEGRTVSVRYEPRMKTSFRQSGLGPRAAATCLWKTEVVVERKIADAAGHPLAAFNRPIGETRTFEGNQPGYCNHVRASQIAPFRGDRGKLRAFVLAAAERDSRALGTELASLGSLGRAVAR